MLKPEYRPRAAYDVESIVFYLGYVLGSPRAAESWYADFKQAIERLCAFPELGRVFEDDRLDTPTRRTYLVGSYRLFYSQHEEKLVVWRVLHTAQDIDDYAVLDCEP